jgi:lipid II:glycine glycyltransferase (peptidoglycan interpeptide bridge formation enzyme)
MSTNHADQNDNGVSVCEVELDSWFIDLFEFEFSLFLLPEWVESVRTAHNVPIYLNIFCGDKVIGKICGLIKDCGKLKGHQFYSFASFALRQPNQQDLNSCHEALLRFAINKKITRIIIGSYDQRNSLSCSTPHYFSTKRLEYIVDLKNNDIKFSKGFLKNVKRAESNNIVIKSSDSVSILERLYELLRLTYNHRVSKYGVVYNPFFLSEMNENSLTKLTKSGCVRLVYASRDEGAANSVQINIEEGGRIYGLLMGSDDVAYDYGIPSFIDYNIITEGQKSGGIYYNTGGVPADEASKGLAQYKASMGGREKIVFGATTNYLVYPQKIMNPLMTIGRKLPSQHPVVKRVKKLFG